MRQLLQEAQHHLNSESPRHLTGEYYRVLGLVHRHLARLVLRGAAVSDGDHSAAAADAYRTSMAATSNPDSPSERRVHALAISGLASALCSVGDYLGDTPDVALLEESHRVAGDLGDVAAMAEARLSQHYHRSGDRERALQHAVKSVSLAEDAQARVPLEEGLFVLAQAQSANLEHDQARDTWQRLRSVCSFAGLAGGWYRIQASIALKNETELAIDWQLYLSSAARADPLAVSLSDVVDMADALYDAGDVDGGLPLVRLAILWGLDRGDDDTVRHLYSILSGFLFSRGDVVGAGKAFVRSVRLREDPPDDDVLAALATLAEELNKESLKTHFDDVRRAIGLENADISAVLGLDWDDKLNEIGGGPLDLIDEFKIIDIRSELKVLAGVLSLWTENRSQVLTDLLARKQPVPLTGPTQSHYAGFRVLKKKSLRAGTQKEKPDAE